MAGHGDPLLSGTCTLLWWAGQLLLSGWLLAGPDCITGILSRTPNKLQYQLVKWYLLEFVVRNDQLYAFEISIYLAVSWTFNQYLYRQRFICLKCLTKYNLPNIVCLC